jgi:hypothetical protein
MNLVYIYGPPGVGKLTVATDLARRTGYKLFHNHLTIAAIEPVFGFGAPTFWRILHRLRDEVMESAAKEGISLIYTVAHTQPSDIVHFERRRELIERHGGNVLLTKLTCEHSVLESRVEAGSRRAFGKLSDLEAWRAYIEGKDVFSPIPGRESLEIDNTHLSPEEVAMRIIRHYALPEETNA